MSSPLYPFTPPPDAGRRKRTAPAPATPVVERIAPQKAGHMFPCHGCGAGLEFAPGQTALKCPYCGAAQELPTTMDQVRELAYEDYFHQARLPQELVEGLVLDVRCPACGAVSAIHSSVAADDCTFCGAHMHNPVGEQAHVMAPQGVLPFRITDRDAKDRFAAWVRSLWFAPNNLQKMASLGRIEGIYLPFWTYDSYTMTFYTGLRGDHYYVTVRDSKGNSRQEQRTRWTPVSGRVNHWFDDVLVCASAGVPSRMIHDLAPWELTNVKDFQPALIAGFRVERYQIDAELGFSHAKVTMDQTIRQLICRDIGGDVQQITSTRTQYDGVTFKHLLLPVWLAAYQYGKKTFRIFVNAQTGEVQGERPWSWIKITLAVLAAAIVIGAFFYFTDGQQ